MKDDEFRPLSGNENRILERLFEVKFMGRDALAQQLTGLLAKPLDENGSLALRSTTPRAADVKGGAIVEASYPVKDCGEAYPIVVHIILHVKKGRLSILEIYRDDSLRVAEPVDPNKFVLFSAAEIPEPSKSDPQP